MEPGEDGQEDVAVVQLPEDDQGLAAGQFTAFYQQRSCIGSGVILESWDDQGFPVCEKALEIARMEDKSKLGKPVKIKVRPEKTPPKGSYQTDRERERELADCQTAITNKKIPSSKLESTSIFIMNWLQKIREKWLHM